MDMKRAGALSLGCGVLLVSGVVLAEGILDRVQLHGFASQAVINTSANNWFGESAQTSFDFTEIGLNGSLRAHRRLLLSSQVLSRRAGEMDDGTPSLDYALADWTLLTSPDYRLGLRLGRIKNPLGVYNETRDVPFTRPGIFLPQVVYFDKVRNLVLSTDGIMAYGEIFTPYGSLSLQLMGGRSLFDENVEWAYLNRNMPGQLEPKRVSGIAALWYATPAERLRVGLSGATLTMQLQDNPLTSGDIDVLYGIASLQYNAENWSLAAEYAREPLAWRDFGPALPDFNTVGEGYYVQGIYRLTPQWQFLARYEAGFGNPGRRSNLFPENADASRIITLGSRWDVTPQWMLRLEYQRHQGAFIVSYRENDQDSLVEHWHLFAALAAFRF